MAEKKRLSGIQIKSILYPFKPTLTQHHMILNIKNFIFIKEKPKTK